VCSLFFSHVQPLHDEITLHRQFSHRNIVEYLGSRSEDGVFKIFMEQVPGGSLSSLIRSKWGPLLNNEGTVAFYAKQILEGVKYLHGQKVVHRDIKGDNVLVNTYSGACKLSDFGTSKRLAGINPITKTFTGTMQFMAPEVIDNGQRGYGPPADIWSVGCTVIEMITGKPPFFELEPAATIFKVGMFKTHPDIPESLSNEAKEFLKRCFDPDPLTRATAEDLLKQSFLARKDRRRNNDMKIVIPKYDKKDSSDTLVTGDSGIDVKGAADMPSSKDLYAHVPQTPNVLHNERSFQSPNSEMTGTNDSKAKKIQRSLTLPARKSDDTLSYTGSSSSSSSTASLESPSPQQSGKDVFFQMKQEAERRKLTVDIIEHESEQICNGWMAKLEHMSSVSILTLSDLKVLLKCIKELMEEKEVPVQSYLGQIESFHGSDKRIYQEIQIALHMFQEAVSEVISKDKRVLPHWMFVVDHMLRTAVSYTLEDFTREMRDKLKSVISVDESDDNISTPTMQGADTVEKSVTFAEPVGDDKSHLSRMISNLSQENASLMKELLSLQENMKKLLTSSVASQKSLIDSFRPTPQSNSQNRRSLSGTHLLNDGNLDPKLETFLREVGVPDAEFYKFAIQECCYEDIIHKISYEDLRDLNLKVGPRSRVWKSIMEKRSHLSSVERNGSNNTTSF